MPTLNIDLEQSDYDHAADVKDEIGLTWEGFIKEATRCLAADRGIQLDD